MQVESSVKIVLGQKIVYKGDMANIDGKGAVVAVVPKPAPSGGLVGKMFSMDFSAGKLVPVDDSPALAEAIIRLLKDPAMRAAMAARSRDRVASHFLTDTMCEHMLLLYRRLLAGRSR